MAAAPASRVSRGPRRQRGVAAVVVAIVLTALLMAMALAIDVGRLYTAQRHLQKLADLAAIDAARVAAGCLVGPVDFEAAEAEAQDSLRRNQVPSDVVASVAAGRRVRDGELLAFEPVAAGRPRDSVQVELTRPSPARILPLFAGPAAKQLQVRAAAQSAVLVQTRVARLMVPEQTDLLNRFLGEQIGSNPEISLAGFRALSNASVTSRELTDPSSTPGSPGQDLQEPTTTTGLLHQLADALDALGDQAAATAVQAFAAAAEAGRGPVSVVPAELLGLPPDAPESLYDEAVIDAGSLLGAVADAVAGPGPIRSPLPLPPPLGDGSSTVTRPGTPTPGTFTPGTDRSTRTDNDGVLNGGGTVGIDVPLRNPLGGAPVSLALALAIQPSSARLSEVHCRRRGLERTTVELRARGGGASFSVGGARGETITDGGYGLTPAPVELLRTRLSALQPGTPLPPGVRDRELTVSVGAGPFEIGDPSSTALCFQGPPWPRPGQATQCDGSPATVGSRSSREALAQIPGLIGEVRLQVDGADDLPPALREALRQRLLEPLQAQLEQVLARLPEPLLPLLQASRLDIGGTAVSVSVSEPPPVIYAR